MEKFSLSYTISGEIYAFLGRFRPKYLHDSSICDKIVNVCEVKYSQDEYELDKEEYERINRRRNTFIKETGLRHASWLTMITTEGLAKGMYSGMIQNVVTLDDLFE